MSFRTVEVHRKTILEKLKITRTAELVRVMALREDAAAPDLLAALKAIVAEIRAYQSPECDEEGMPGAAELKAADAAIAKAKGRA
jgi:hypothetical protein